MASMASFKQSMHMSYNKEKYKVSDDEEVILNGAKLAFLGG